MATLVRWSPERLASASDGVLIRSGNRPIASAFVDSRHAKSDALFIPLVAARDGHDFIEAAVLAGASAFLTAQGRPRPSPAFCDQHDLTVVEVDDTLDALVRLAHASARNGGGPRVAITGSNGKTTTRAYVGAVVACAYPRLLQTHGNFNNHIGLPLSLLGEPHEPQARVLELGMSAPGENRHLADILQPTISVVTSIALEHLETMGSLAAIAQAEAEPFARIGPDGAIVIPDDEPLLEREISPHALARVWRFGSTERADIRILETTVGAPTRGRLALPDGAILTIEVQAIGRHNLRNAAAAVAVGEHLGIDRTAMCAALAKVEPVGDRGRTIQWGKHVLIADCYNANPGSMRAGLDTLSDLASDQGRRAFAVLGDMLELGPTQDELHRELGEVAAKAQLDGLVTVGQFTRHTSQSAERSGLTNVLHVDDMVEQASAWILAQLATSEQPAAILFKGSRGMRIERVLNTLLGAATTA